MVSPVYVAAAVASAAGAGLWLYLFQYMAGSHRRLAWAVLLGLPLSFAVNVWVKGPVYRAVSEAAGIDPGSSLALAPVWFLVFRLMLAPLAEEAIKVAPLLARPVRGHLTGAGAALWLGAYLGTGFGLGEIWHIASRLAPAASYSGLGGWAYTGFVTERVIAVFGHAALSGLLLRTAAGRGPGWGRSGRAVRGFAAAAALHALVNLGALLQRIGRFGPLATYAWTTSSFAVLVFVFLRLHSLSLDRSGLSGQVVFQRRKE